ncbi:Outer dense fiber protein 3-like protein 2 [Mactra antiquata]
MQKGPIIAAKERGPGPGRYALPSTVGFEYHDATKRTDPAYSFGRRLVFKDNKDGPGPAYYIDPCMTRHGKDGTPVYSLLKRQSDPKNFKTPGPGTYQPENVHPQGEVIAPKHSIGFRSRYRKLDHNPSPNKYILPPVIGPQQAYKTSAASYSMTGRSKIGCYLEDLAKAPGPGHTQKVHPDIYMTQAPHYSLRSRSFMPSDSVKKPGPGAYSPENVKINRPAAPSYSLGVRHTEYTCPLITDIQ